ncbi:hypothetical protein Trydic_g20416 [Trypoxylus dichotomus]
MASKFCTIIFDKPNNVYHPGDTLSGKIVIGLQKPKDIKGIRVHHRGSSETSWEDSTFESGSVGNIKVMIYAAEEVYFDTISYCTEGGNSELITLGRGKHVFKFSYDLPHKLPSSYKGEVGRISYFTEVTFERSWRKDQKLRSEFQITSGYDLNVFPELKNPTQSLVDKRFCCWCCSSGPLQANVLVPKTGYLCGERIDVAVEVDNASRVDIGAISLKFQEFTIFYGTYLAEAPKKVARVYEEIQLGGVKANASKAFKKSFIIPKGLPNSCIYESAIIKPEYQISLEISPGAFRKLLKASIPIKIGTIGFNKGTRNGIEIFKTV